MGATSLALKSLSWVFRAIQFCCAAIILGIFSYFLATLVNHHLHIPTWIKAVEGISALAVLYTLFALLFVCCLGGMVFFSSLGILLDICFLGSFIYLAVATRHGRSSCSGPVDTPLGSGNTNIDNTVPSGTGGKTKLPSLKVACRLNKACFAVAIIGLVFFFFSLFVELTLIRQRKREKGFGPGPSNDYTEGPGKRRFWQRKPKRDAEYNGLEGKRQPDSLPQHTTPGDMRTSYATDSTAVGNEPTGHTKYGPGVPSGQQDIHPSHIGQTNQGYGTQTGYTTQPTTHTAHANQGATRTNYATQPPANVAYANQQATHTGYVNQPTAGYSQYANQPAAHAARTAYGNQATAEMPGDEAFTRTGEYAAHNASRVGNY